MSTINSILLPVDFSDVAKNAFRYTVELASKTTASVHLLHCIPDSGTDTSPFLIVPYAEQLKEAKRDMDKFLHGELRLAKENNITLPPISKVVKGDNLNTAVEKLAAEKKIDLLVMGTKGRSNEWEKVLGSKTSYLINQAPCPVLVVPADAKYDPVKRICVATDLTNTSTFKLEGIDHIFRSYQPELYFLHIVTHQRKTKAYDLDMLREVARGKYPESSLNFAEIENTDVVNGLFRYARKKTCQLVVMHRPEKNWLERTFKTSNTREAILKADLPILIIADRS